jgi:hypothetical protein
MIDVGVMVGNTWRHVGSPPLALSLLRAYHYYNHLTFDNIPSLNYVFTIPVSIGALNQVRRASFNQTPSCLPSYPSRCDFRLS